MDVKELAKEIKNFYGVDCSSVTCDECPFGHDLCNEVFSISGKLEEREKELNPEPALNYSPQLLKFMSDLENFIITPCVTDGKAKCESCKFNNVCDDILDLSSKLMKEGK